MRAVRSWSLMSKFQQIVDRLVLPLPPRVWLWAVLVSDHCQSGYLLPEVPPLPRCSQVISFEMTHNETIENDHNRMWILEGCSAAREQMSASAYQTHYCSTQHLPAQPNGCYNWSNVLTWQTFLGKGKMEKKKKLSSSSRTGQLAHVSLEPCRQGR